MPGHRLPYISQVAIRISCISSVLSCSRDHYGRQEILRGKDAGLRRTLCDKEVLLRIIMGHTDEAEDSVRERLR